MSSGFVSGGTTENPVQRDDEWLEAQQDIEATRLRKVEESRNQGGRSLFEVLEQNKAAKQDAFEESIRLKNQFRNLDEDEVEFLDSVLESTRVKEAAVKEETTKQLKHFRRQQEESDRSLLRELAGQGGTQAENLGSPPDMESSWIVNTRKRKRNKEKDMVNIVKLRKSSSTSDSVSQGNSAKEERGISVDSHTASIEGTPHGEKPRTNDSPGDYKMRTTTITELISEKPTLPPQITTPVTKGTRRLPDLGLGSYSSDEEE